MAASEVILTNGTTPTTPASGKSKTFFNTSKNFSQVDDAGRVLDFVIGAATYNANPADPSGTTSTTGVMMGLAGSFTPAFSGRMLVFVTGDLSNSTGTDGGKVQMAYGTGGAPANGAAITGTTIGSRVQGYSPSANQHFPFCLVAVVTGLTFGTAYWIDITLAAITGGTANVFDTNITAVEV